jgi:hypothetical protein
MVDEISPGAILSAIALAANTIKVLFSEAVILI